MADRAGPARQPARARGARRQTAVLEAARALFIERGYRGTTLDAIIARAGGSRETIYRAFGDKRGLLSAIIAQVGDPIAARVEDARDDPRAAVRKFGLEIVSFWLSAEGQAMNRMVVAEGVEAREVLETWYASAIDPSLEALGHQIGRVLPDGTEMVGVRSRQFLFLLAGETMFHLMFDVERHDIVEEIVDRCLDLLLPKPA